MAALFHPSDVAELKAAIMLRTPDFEPSTEFLEATIKGHMLINGGTSREAVRTLSALANKAADDRCEGVG